VMAKVRASLEQEKIMATIVQQTSNRWTCWSSTTRMQHFPSACNVDNKNAAIICHEEGAEYAFFLDFEIKAHEC
jgi:hypothetical protein